jgi:pantoate--beta-alanine ligase
MRVIKKIKDMKVLSESIRRSGESIGFVPTMGALHKGHLSLIERARRETEHVVISIFVNPLQFSPGEDYRRYPRPFQKDMGLAEGAGVDIVFCPSRREMFRNTPLTSINVEKLCESLCGPFRPGHFQGVTIVVAKLFNIVRPSVAYFGQKDYQQAIIIKRMVSDLSFDIKIRVLPTIREKDGLAISSRNTYLRPAEREKAPCLYRGLCAGKRALDKGERDPKEIKKTIAREIKAVGVTPEYISIVDTKTLQDLPKIETCAVLAVAAKIGSARLIDNLIWRDNRNV